MCFVHPTDGYAQLININGGALIAYK